MNEFLNSITIKEIITVCLAVSGYIIAFWQYTQKTKVEFRLKKYSEKRSLYEKYIAKFAELNKVAREAEQLEFEKEFNFIHAETKDEKEKIELTKSYVKNILSSGLIVAKHLKEYNNSLDILYIGSSLSVLNFINQLKAEYDKLSTEIHLKLRKVKKDETPQEVAKVITELSDLKKLEKIQTLQAQMIDQMRKELEQY